MKKRKEHNRPNDADVNIIREKKLTSVRTAGKDENVALYPVSYTHLRAHETVLDIVCRLLLEKKTHSLAHDLYSVNCTEVHHK